MKPKPLSNGMQPTAEQDNFGKFTEFMRRLVAVPHSEIKAKLDAEKQAKQQRRKRSSSSRASHGKD